MKILKEYFELQKQIFDYFGYVEDWKVIPLDDQTDQYWILNEKEHGGSYAYCKKREDFMVERFIHKDFY